MFFLSKLKSRVQSRSLAEKNFIFAIEYWNFAGSSTHRPRTIRHYFGLLFLLSLIFVTSPHEPYKILLKLPLTLVHVTSPHKLQLPWQRYNILHHRTSHLPTFHSFCAIYESHESNIMEWWHNILVLTIEILYHPRLIIYLHRKTSL